MEFTFIRYIDIDCKFSIDVNNGMNPEERKSSSSSSISSAWISTYLANGEPSEAEKGG